ncbi:uncharacterized protein LOC129296945 isoform X2 [Prosopis cineraria]|uniref:uncharacterized protein LOC129296945 isoform X2 n=1 Tax=Prosopis cineraria TaxID=364024 RepID=UPI00240F859A|nr:uncharacterized protein LOC129296945 isoform X2 [Prosopis cineraria]
MLLVHGILNWFLGLFSFTENNGLFSSSFSDYSNNNDKPWLLFITCLVILGFGLLLLHCTETKQSDNTTLNYGNEEFQSLIDLLKEEEDQEQPGDQTGLGFVAVYEQPATGDRTANNGGGRSDGACCAFCGNLSTTRCSRCKTARYCSRRCQVLHWRLVHKNECRETKTVDPETHQSHEALRIVNKSKKEGFDEWNSGMKDTDGSHNATGKPTQVSGDALSNCFSCALCGCTATTRCSRCKAVRYCSAKCLIEDWRWHKVECTPKNVDSAQTERPSPGNVGLLENPHQEEGHDHSPHPLALGFYSEGTTNTNPLITGCQEPTKRPQDHTVEGVRCHEDEIAMFRNEIIFLKEERDKWAARANFARQRYQSLKKESEHLLLVLSNQKKLISNAEAQAQNAVHHLSERLQDLQIAVQANFAEKRKQEEYIQKLESKCAELKRELQKEWEHIQELTAAHDERHKTAEIAMREVEEKEKELQSEREYVQLLKEDFRRDVAAAESRTMIAEARLLDLDRKIRSRNDKVAVWTDSFGRPAMACAICLSNEKDLAFGCGHMTCRECGSKLSKCPICREQITSFVRLYPG